MTKMTVSRITMKIAQPAMWLRASLGSLISLDGDAIVSFSGMTDF